MVSEAIAPGTGCTCRRSGRSATRWSGDLAVRAEDGQSGPGYPPRRRVRRHFPLSGGHLLSPAELTGILAALHDAGLPEDRPFDVAVAGNASPAWPEPGTVDLGALAGAGMTWWMESLIHFDPLELSLEIVDAGPPR